MKKTGVAQVPRAIAGILFSFAFVLSAVASTPQYVVTNDDVMGNFSQNGVTFYTVGANGSLTFLEQVPTAGFGISGGYFPANRVRTLNAGNNQCVFASDAASGDISFINVNTLSLGGSVTGSQNDTGASNGIGLALNSQYLYASFTDASTIGTFQIQPGCALSFVGDVQAGGLQGGIVDGMAVNGNIMVVTYGDGSIESFNLASGLPVSNGDKQNSTGAAKGNSYPSGVDITQDGHFAIFGDTSTSTLIEVSDISSGKLSQTIAYLSPTGINSSNVMLSPDESLLYISNTQGSAISAAFFDKTNGTLGKGCRTGLLQGYGSVWYYLGGLTLASPNGTGQAVYAAEYGPTSSIAVIPVVSSNEKCALTGAANTPVSDPNSPGLLSIATFPPRAF
jgi:6-phosphogluconolactonase (cycloisomerase 2 family)